MRSTPGRMPTTAASPGFAVGTAALFVLTYAVLLHETVGLPRPGVVFGTLAVVNPVIRYHFGDALSKHRAGAASKLRLFVLVHLISYLLLFLAQSRPALGHPPATDGLSLLAVGYHTALLSIGFGIAAAMHGVLLDRRTLLAGIYRHKRTELRRTAARDLAYASSDAMQNLSKVRTVIRTMFGGLIAVIGLGWINGRLPTFVGALLFAASATARYLSGAAIEAFLDEYRYLGDGNRLPSRYRRRRLAHAAILLLIAAAAASLFVSDRSLVPYRVVQQFFAWLSGLFPEVDLQAPSPPPQQPTGIYERLPEELGLGDESVRPGAVVTLILTILQRLIVGASVTGVLIFLVAPLFSRRFRRYFLNMQPRAAVAKWIADLRRRLDFLRRLVRRLFRRRPPAASSGGLLRRRTVSSNRTDGPEPSHKRIRQLRKTSRYFRRLLKWAERRGTPRNRGEAAAEFVERLGHQIPEAGNHPARVGRLYEQSIFSQSLLSDDELSAFVESVRLILRK